VHACFGTRVNQCISRIFSKRLSQLVGESVWAVSDPYRIIIKLPFPLKEEHITKALTGITSVRVNLEEALENSPLLRFKFLHVGRMFGLLSEDASVSNRFISALRYSVVYEETIRSIFFRYFDVDRTEEVLEGLRKGDIKLIVDSREKPSFFARVGMDRISGGEAVGMFEPRERIISAFKENALSKTLRLKCLNCGATRFMHLAGAPEEIKCHSCREKSYSLLDREGKPMQDPEFSAGLIRAYGKKALVALSTYGVGPSTADRVLKRLHRDEEGFYLDLIEAQKSFIKNKKYWRF
jgi:ATP-dependent Lhr-like helicase